MSTKVLPDTEVVRLVNFFFDCKLSEKDRRFGKESYISANSPSVVSLLVLFFFACPNFFLPPDHPAVMQRFPGKTATGMPAPGHKYLAGRTENDVDDLELGATTMEEDDAAGGGSEGAGGSAGGGLGD